MHNRIVGRLSVGRNAVRRVGLTAGIGLAALLGIPLQAANATVTLPILQFNMCGNVCNSGSLTVADDVVNSVNARSPQPDVLTLEEVCRSQYMDMYSKLTPYYGVFTVTVAGACANGDDYGIAILVRTSSFTDLGATTLPKAVASETRKMECVKTSAFGGSQPLVACVTHIDYNSQNLSGQISSVASRATGYYSGNHVVVGGDFNASPNNTALNPMYTSSYSPAGTGVFNEADAPSSLSRTPGYAGGDYNELTECPSKETPCGWGTTNLPNVKIDFVFMGRGDFASYSADATYANHSDHTPYWATGAMY